MRATNLESYARTQRSKSVTYFNPTATDLACHDAECNGSIK